MKQEMPVSSRFTDRTGNSYSRLTVEGYAGKRGKHHVWDCVCECGGKSVVTSTGLDSGHSKSCGCFKREITKQLNISHGESASKLYKVWASIKDRCTNSSNKSHHNYGGRGLFLADEFLEYAQFRDYVALELGPKPTIRHSIDRIDNDLGYVKGNLRWADRDVQRRNSRRTIKISVCGEQMLLSDAAQIFGVSGAAARRRYHCGWNTVDIFLGKRHGGISCQK